MMKMLERIKEFVANKKRSMEDARKVYTGGFREDGRWERDSLALAYPEVSIVDAPADGEPEPVMGKKEFIGGNGHRVMYLAVEDFMAKYPRLGEWWEKKGDSHLLASMFLRPGKLAVRRGEVKLPPRCEEEVNDGVLMAMSREAWEGFVEMMGLPEATWAQVTVFAPEYGVVAKGSIRRVLPGEQPATYVSSWKSLPEDVEALLHTNIAVLETDATYRPQASINLQEYTYWVKGRNTRLAQWVLEAIGREQQRVLSEEKVSVSTTWGYLQALGLPAPDELMGEVIKGQEGALYDLLGRWPLSAKEGWRGKVSGSVRVTETENVREILLPEGCGDVGDVVYVSRNPALAVNGWVRYTVVGHVEGNVAYVSGQPGTAFNAILGGDFDGDDLVVLFQCPVEEYSEPTDVNLQDWKANGRAFGSQTVEDRIARWKKEVNSNIGRWDVLARYAVDLGVADSRTKTELAKLVQFTISLKKRVGELEVPESIKQLAAEVAPVKEFTPTYLLRGYREMDRAQREMLLDLLRAGGHLRELDSVVRLVEEGLEAIKAARPRWSLKAASEVARKYEAKPHLEEAAKAFFQEFAGLVKAQWEAAQANDGDLKSQLGREVRYLTQVRMPEYMMGLGVEEAKAFSAALVRVNPRADWWLFAAHPEFLKEVLETTFATEKAMLVGEHNLKEGDEVTIPAGVRKVEVGGKVLKLSNGILLFEGEAVARVVKVYATSVVLDFGKTMSAAKTKVKTVDLLDF